VIGDEETRLQACLHRRVSFIAEQPAKQATQYPVTLATTYIETERSGVEMCDPVFVRNILYPTCCEKSD